MVTIKQILTKSSLPHLETRDLLCHILKKEPAFILAHPEFKLSSIQVSKLNKLIKLRKQGYPLPYLLESQPFAGLNFFVNKNVLIPRPETEELVIAAVQAINQTPQLATLADIGTGCGNIAIALAYLFRHLPAKIHLLATDNSTPALKLAKKNAQQHGMTKHITFLKGNLLIPIFKHISNPKHLIIVANLPYLTASQYQTNRALRFEPKSALISGKTNGLGLYEQLLQQLSTWLKKSITQKITLILEIDPKQNQAIKKLVKKYLPKAQVRISKDLNHNDRLCLVEI